MISNFYENLLIPPWIQDVNYIRTLHHSSIHDVIETQDIGLI